MAMHLVQKCSEVKYDVMYKQNKTKGVITTHEHLFVHKLK